MHLPSTASWCRPPARRGKATPAYAEGHAMQLGHDLDAMLAAIDDSTRLVFIANPNNPTGTWNTAAQITQFLQAVPPTVIVVLDEAYFEYSRRVDCPDGTALLRNHPNLVVLRTFSKAHALAGVRVGLWPLASGSGRHAQPRAPALQRDHSGAGRCRSGDRRHRTGATRRATGGRRAASAAGRRCRSLASSCSRLPATSCWPMWVTAMLYTKACCGKA